jgi:hypothetical protein
MIVEAGVSHGLHHPLVGCFGHLLRLSFCTCCHQLSRSPCDGKQGLFLGQAADGFACFLFSIPVLKRCNRLQLGKRQAACLLLIVNLNP